MYIFKIDKNFSGITASDAIYIGRDPCTESASPSTRTKATCPFGLASNPSCSGSDQVCARGPGQVCGGTNSIFGVCAEGLACSNCYR